MIADLSIEYEGARYEVKGFVVLKDGSGLHMFTSQTITTADQLRIFAIGYRHGHIDGVNAGRSRTQTEIKNAIGL